MHAFDRQTDGQTEFSSLDRDCIPCSAVKSYALQKMVQFFWPTLYVTWLTTMAEEKEAFIPITSGLSRLRTRKCWSVGSSRVSVACWSTRSIACLRFLSTWTKCQKLSLSGYAVIFSRVWIPLPTSNRNWIMLPTDHSTWEIQLLHNSTMCFSTFSLW